MGEAIALTVADVEFLKRRIAVHRNAVQVGQDFEVGQTKGMENRAVPVAASVMSRLAVRCEAARRKICCFRRAPVRTFTPHDLRHTCASLAVSSGANVLAVPRMLGHKDPSVTLKIYADLFDTDLDAVAVSLDAKIATVSKAPADCRRKRRKAAV